MKEWFIKLSISKKLTLIAGLLGVLALFIENTSNKNVIDVNAKEMALSTIRNRDRIDPVILADWLIKENSDFTLVDLRSEKEFSEYNIPTSVNIPIENVLASDLMRNQKILLYGNDDVTSAQAWFILRSSNYKAIYILKGGMNGWKKEILFPTLAVNATPEQSSEFEKIKQISLHFGGTPQLASAEQSTTSAAIVKPNLPSLPKLTVPAGGKAVKKKKEGC
ncbi:MAG: hypothetical protein A3J84_00100 [Ignavibacteria bacterium RIFOXYA2_FULL_37_17]|nr:MAG: hypothetical protein A3J84_00100 [Ignavibacteria bacterium RIFOXYA2_FULL_37_17]